MSEFWGPFIETLANVGLLALLVRWALKHLTILPPKHLALAAAFGLFLGRHQMADGLSNLATVGSGAGGVVALGLLWFFWFRRASNEMIDG